MLSFLYIKCPIAWFYVLMFFYISVYVCMHFTLVMEKIIFTRSAKEVKIDEICLIHGRLDAGDVIMRKKNKIKKAQKGN